MGRIYLPSAWKDHLDTDPDSSISEVGIANLWRCPFRNHEVMPHPYALAHALLALAVEGSLVRDLGASLLLFGDELLPRLSRHQAKPRSVYERLGSTRYE
jgi:hypothetical protein